MHVDLHVLNKPLLNPLVSRWWEISQYYLSLFLVFTVLLYGITEYVASSNVYLIPSSYVYQMRAEEGRPYYEYIVQSHLASDSDYDNFSIHQYRPRRNNNQQNVRNTDKTAIFNIITLEMDCSKKTLYTCTVSLQSRVNIWGVPVQRKAPSRNQQLLVRPTRSRSLSAFI